MSRLFLIKWRPYTYLHKRTFYFPFLCPGGMDDCLYQRETIHKFLTRRNFFEIFAYACGGGEVGEMAPKINPMQWGIIRRPDLGWFGASFGIL